MAVYYSVVYGNQTVGTVQETSAGLYRIYSCKCTLPKDGMFRLWLHQGNREEKLGVLCPEGDSFTLTKKIPSSRFSEEEITFFVRLPVEETFVPIIPGQPFPALRALPYGRFTIENGQPGIVFSRNIQEIGTPPTP